MKRPDQHSSKSNTTATTTIDNFNGYYQFLNNDYPTWVEYQGLMFPNVSTAFQAARTNNLEIRKRISQIQDYQEFKSLVSTIPNPENWYGKRFKVMEKLVRDKFKRNKEISNRLAGTDQKSLVNCYKQAGQNQNYWGAIKINTGKTVEYKGTNNLGKILQAIRTDILKFQDTEKWITFQNLQEDGDLYPEVQILVLKQGKAIEKLDLNSKNYFLFGSHSSCQFKLQHPSISKFHAGIYFSQLEVILVDTNSSHGTYLIRSNGIDGVNNGKAAAKQKLEAMSKTSLFNGDRIIFGMSSRTYQFKINFQKAANALKVKQADIQQRVFNLKQENSKIKTEGISVEQLKSNLGFKKYQGLYVRRINKDYSYNDIKQMFQQFGKIEKVRMLNQNRINDHNPRSQGEQVLVLYQTKQKMEEIFKEIQKSQDQRIKVFNIKPIDKFQMEEILAKNRSDRERDRDRDRNRDRDRDRDFNSQRRSRSREKTNKRNSNGDSRHKQENYRAR